MSGTGKILDLVADWPGSANDSRILGASALQQCYIDGQYRGILLGDSGYPLKTWLFTPILEPMDEAEVAYNRLV